MAGGPDPNEVLPKGVQPHMRQPMLGWLEESCADYLTQGYWELMAQMLQIDYTGTRPQQAIIGALNKDNDLLLDLVDARLQLGEAWRHHDNLDRILFLAGSGWRLNEDKDGLEEVVDDSVRQATMAAIKEAEESASQHLKNAWSETHGRDRNPTHAHAEMIRAVESAARPVVTPKDLKATLGTIYRQMETQGSLYTTAGASDANDGVAGIVAMMKTLWEQQTDRHGANPTVPATQERVEFLLPVAAALVHAFSTGAVRRI
jgi:hypothetical protein